ncbi:MAG TPA: TlpA disulfide reductase family protein [Bacteroidales bacterium]|nr:TlpA disulfide reductase family protein [Bacteroidales bacterium]
MKKLVARLIIATVVVVVLLLMAGTVARARKVNETAERVRTLPDFTFPTVEGGLFSSTEITKGPLLITYFHPECEHCQYEISSLFESDLLDGNLKVVLVSYACRTRIKEFMQQFNTERDTLLWVLSDTSLAFREIFGTEIIPSNFIYDKNLELVKVLKGEIRTETILKYLRSDH